MERVDPKYVQATIEPEAGYCCDFCSDDSTGESWPLYYDKPQFKDMPGTFCKTKDAMKSANCADEFFSHGECYEPTEDQATCDDTSEANSFGNIIGGAVQAVTGAAGLNNGCGHGRMCVTQHRKVLTLSCGGSRSSIESKPCPVYRTNYWKCVPNTAVSPTEGEMELVEAKSQDPRAGFCCDFCSSPGPADAAGYKWRFTDAASRFEDLPGPSTLCKKEDEVKLARCSDDFFSHGRCYEPVEDEAIFCGDAVEMPWTLL
jgi:hypothetical protein